MSGITCDGLIKHYGTATVVENFVLSIKDGEFIVFLGPSGSGKSTILRMIAGLESIDGGSLRIGARDVTHLPARERKVAMVFQNYALYPHMTVYGNIAFGLRRLKTAKDEIERRVHEVAGMLNLTPLLERRPAQMSGGQQQRVAIARAMIKTPDVFLFDEPLSNLDAKLRAQLRGDIKRLHLRLATTSVYVTHDQLEAMTLADRIVLLKDGRIEQVGTPAEIYNRPRTLFAAGFIGTPAMNLVQCSVDLQHGRAALVIPAADGWSLPMGRFSVTAGQAVVLGIRPNHLGLAPPASGGPAPCIGGCVDLVELLGAESQVTLRSGEALITAIVPANDSPAVGDRVTLYCDPANLHLFDAATGISLLQGSRDGERVDLAADPAAPGRQRADEHRGAAHEA